MNTTKSAIIKKGRAVKEYLMKYRQIIMIKTSFFPLSTILLFLFLANLGGTALAGER